MDSDIDEADEMNEVDEVTLEQEVAQEGLAMSQDEEIKGLIGIVERWDIEMVNILLFH